MKIIYLGHSCFQLISKQGVSLLTDPYTGVGYEMKKTATDILTVSHSHFDHACVEKAFNYVLLADKEEKYAYNDVEIEGERSFHDPKQGSLRGENVIFKIKMDGMTICHLGDLGEPCSPSILQKIGEVDILLLPVGGTYTIDAEEAKKYVEAIAPKAVIPMHYKPIDGSLDIAPIEKFLSLFGDKAVEELGSEITLFEKDLSMGKTRVMYMTRRR